MTRERMDELEKNGRIHWPKKDGGMPRLKVFPEDLPGTPLQDIWTDIKMMHNLAAERLGYPTQKPVELLKRIVQASSNEGDVVLDPFCGCGTTIAAAQELNRQWIGIDITHLSIALQKYRLRDAFGLEPGEHYAVIGEPKDASGARQLAQDDPYQFQFWALSLIQARPVGAVGASKQGKKGADRGIDGVINFIDDSSGKPKRVIVQVKGGKVGASHIRDLVGTVERENAAIGVYISMEPPTGPMKREAAAAGIYHSDVWGQDYPKIQLLTIEELLNGATVQMPPISSAFKQAERVKRTGRQPTLGIY